MEVQPVSLKCKRCQTPLAFMQPDRLIVGSGCLIMSAVTLTCAVCKLKRGWRPSRKPIDTSSSHK